MKISETLKSRKGAAIEMAIGFMLVIFALASILTMTYAAVKMQDRRMKEYKEENINLDEVGERFVTAVRGGTKFPSDEEKDQPWAKEYNYEYMVKACLTDANALHHILKILDPETGETMLNVTVRQIMYTESQSEYTVVNWSKEETSWEYVEEKSIDSKKYSNNYKFLQALWELFLWLIGK